MTTHVSPAPRLSATDVSVLYDAHAAVDGLSVDIPAGAITTIIGPNGCGKSTLLRTMGRLLLPDCGAVALDGTDLGAIRRRELAHRLGILPQSPVAPEGILVADLVSRGRHPHQTWYNQWSRDDADVVRQSLALTGCGDLADRRVDSLSGGQRQRIWIAMVLAQHTATLLLDEPTTYLDLSHSIDLLNLVRQLRDDQDRTIVMVLHDLNLAIRYSDHLIAMHAGRVHAAGAPRDIITPDLLRHVFSLDALVIDDPVTGGPLVVPR